MKNTEHIKVTEKNPSLIPGSEIGTIVKYYLNKDFYTFNDFKTVITRRFILTSKERKLFDEANNKGKEFLFNRGNKFEANVIQDLINKHSENFEIINFNDFKENDINKIFVNEELGICAVPDVLLIGKEKNILCEIKSSECGGKSTENYKYQLVAESLLVEEFYEIETISRLLFEKPNKETEETIITLSKEEKTIKANEIIRAIKLLKEDLKDNKLKFFTFDEMMEKFKEPETIEIIDEKILQIVREIEANKIQYQAYKENEDKLKELCKTKFGNKTINLLLTENNGMKYSIKHSVSRETYYTAELKAEAVLKAEKALEDTKIIEVGSIKTASKFGVKVCLM